jgi:hypothetical protein
LLGGRQGRQIANVGVTTTAQLRAFEGNRVAFGVVLIVGRAGVGCFREVDETRRERLDECLQPTALVMNTRSHLGKTWFGAVHDNHCGPTMFPYREIFRRM